MPLSFRHAWRGALTAGILLVIINQVFPTYVSLTMGGSKNYGSTIYIALIFVAWCWLFAVVTLLGAEVNSYAMGMRATEGDLATLIHQERVHEEGADTPPGHGSKPGGYAGRERRVARRERRKSARASQPPSAPVRAISAGARATGHGLVFGGSVIGRALGAVAVTLLSVIWLVVRIVHRTPDMSGFGPGRVTGSDTNVS